MKLNKSPKARLEMWMLRLMVSIFNPRDTPTACFHPNAMMVNRISFMMLLANVTVRTINSFLQTTVYKPCNQCDTMVSESLRDGP